MKAQILHCLAIPLLFLFCTVTRGQDSGEKLDPAAREEIKADVKKVVSAVFRADVETIGKHTHERVIAMVGTKEQFLEAMKGVFASLDGIELVSVDVPDDMDAFSGSEHEFVLVPTTITIRIQGKEQEPNEGFQFGVRKKGEKIWKYIDCSALTTELAREWFKDFPAGKKIPAPE